MDEYQIHLNQIIDNLRYLANQNSGLTAVVSRWRHDPYGSCKQGLVSSDPIINDLCTNDTNTIIRYIIGPLRFWLQTYRDYIRVGKLFDTEEELTEFVSEGLEFISNFAVVAEYFMNTEYAACWQDEYMIGQGTLTEVECDNNNRMFGNALVSITSKIVDCSLGVKSLVKYLYKYSDKSQKSLAALARIHHACESFQSWKQIS